MGFVVCSEEYMDAGIPHRDMRLKLDDMVREIHARGTAVLWVRAL